MKDVAAEVLDHIPAVGAFHVRWWNVSRSGTDPWPLPGRPYFCEAWLYLEDESLDDWTFTDNLKELQR